MALLLKRQGITRVRPLAGGFEAWRERGYPLEGTLVQLPDLDETTPNPSEPSPAQFTASPEASTGIRVRINRTPPN